jgi:hypothetical protein
MLLTPGPRMAPEQEHAPPAEAVPPPAGRRQTCRQGPSWRQPGRRPGRSLAPSLFRAAVPLVPLGVWATARRLQLLRAGRLVAGQGSDHRQAAASLLLTWLRSIAALLPGQADRRQYRGGGDLLSAQEITQLVALVVEERAGGGAAQPPSPSEDLTDADLAVGLWRVYLATRRSLDEWRKRVRAGAETRPRRTRPAR